jgi:PAS domain S-box-containing protein
VIICLDTQFRILEWNRAAEEIYGWTRAEVRGKNYVEWFLPEEVRTRVAEEIQRVFSGGESENYENPIMTRDGTERLLLWNSTSLVNGEGKTWGLVAIAQDITEQKLAERQRELATHEMEVMLERFEALRGLLRVCSVCKKIQDQRGNWSSLDEYLLVTAEVQMSHGYCPKCLERVTADRSS